MKIEERLRETLSRQAGHVRPSEDAWSAIDRRATHHAVSGRLVAATVAMLVSALSFGVLWSAFRADPDVRQPADSAHPIEEVEAFVDATIPVGAFPRAVAAGEGGVWVSVQGAHDSSILRLDPGTNEPNATISVPVAPDHLAFGAGALWGTVEGAGGSVIRIDPFGAEVVATVPIGGGDYVQDIAADGEAVWVAVVDGKDGSNSLARIDPNTDSISARATLPEAVLDMQMSDGVLWLLGEGDVIRVDGTTGDVLGTTRASASGSRLSAGPTGVWMQSWLSNSSESGTGSADRVVAVRLDPQTGDVVGDPVQLNTGFAPFATDEAGVWFYGAEESGNGVVVSRLRGDGSVDASVVLQTPPADAALDPTGRTVWVANEQESVTRIELRP